MYSVYQYPELLDSSNMSMRDWRSIAEDIWVRVCKLYTYLIIYYYTYEYSVAAESSFCVHKQKTENVVSNIRCLYGFVFFYKRVIK